MQVLSREPNGRKAHRGEEPAIASRYSEAEQQKGGGGGEDVSQWGWDPLSMEGRLGGEATVAVD